MTQAYGDRIVSATDNSIYQLLPQLVVFPRGVEDLVRIARVAAEPRFKDIVFAARGGGTGTNGQSLTEGLVVDVSRHMKSGHSTNDLCQLSVRSGRLAFFDPGPRRAGLS